MIRSELLQALAKETDEASAERLEKLRAEMAELTEQLSGLKAQWQSEKDVIVEIRGAEGGEPQRLLRVRSSRYGSSLGRPLSPISARA